MLHQFFFSVMNTTVHNANMETVSAQMSPETAVRILVIFEDVALFITFSTCFWPLPSDQTNLKTVEVPFDDKFMHEYSNSTSVSIPLALHLVEPIWSTYKLMQLAAKSVLATAVVGSSRDIPIRGIVICSIYFLNVVLSSYG